MYIHVLALMYEPLKSIQSSRVIDLCRNLNASKRPSSSCLGTQRTALGPEFRLSHYSLIVTHVHFPLFTLVVAILLLTDAGWDECPFLIICERSRGKFLLVQENRLLGGCE